ncbi:DUF3429 domain-containing protein [Thiomicrospira microaerophila]|uniref:DUF3429 domain-containing protein n=1 Tax=Thiomicrospira microaerophila TaxID=406020 RepID=UPI0005CAB8C4|nr:DUF3429 domain-containing protein [Thiomicrospira microaerophila]
MSPIRLAQILTYLGTLPFIYGALASLQMAPLANLMPFDIQQALLGYALVILSFIAGIHWGVALSKMAAPDQARPEQARLAGRLLLMSNVIALWAWCIWLWALSSLSPFSFWGLALGFGVMLVLDWRWLSLPQAKPWFWRLRWQASLVAILSLSLAGWYVG